MRQHRPSFAPCRNALELVVMNTPESDLHHELSREESQKKTENLRRYFELAFEIASQNSEADNKVDNPFGRHTMTERSKEILKT
jgi:hypothetical protein